MPGALRRREMRPIRFNPAGRCPVVVVPAGRDELGVPIGVQVVGRTYDDLATINAARAIELERPWPLVSEAWRRG